MQTIHIRAENKAFETIMEVINTISKDGGNIEIIDNRVYQEEQKIIFQALLEEQKGEVFEHDEMWNDLLR